MRDDVPCLRRFVTDLRRERPRLRFGAECAYTMDGETLGQLEHVRVGGCVLIQGYLYSKPVPEEELLTLLETGYLKPEP